MIAAAAPGGPAEVLHVDVSIQRSIRAFARACKGSRPPIDVLINHAGTIQRERRESVDGIELTFATNVLGYEGFVKATPR